MEVLLSLLAREAGLLLTLFALGSGIAAHLPERVPARAALAPALGLSAGVGLLTAVSWFTRLEHAFWFVVLPGAAVSLWSALRARRRRRGGQPEEAGGSDGEASGGRLARYAVLAPVVVAALALGIFTYPLVERRSLGVMGYGIFDASSYINYMDGYARYENDDPTFSRPPIKFLDPALDDQVWGGPWNLGARYGWLGRWQHTSANTLPATLARPFGWEPWNLLTPFMAVLVAVGALGVFALTRALTKKVWPATLAGILAAGPAAFQVYMDGSGGLVASLALLPALVAVGLAALERRQWYLTIVFGLLLAGLQASYPEHVPMVGGSIAIVLAVRALALLVRRRPMSDLGEGLRHAAVAGAVGLVASPRTAYWTVDYIVEQLTASESTNFVGYQMRLPYLPGWLAQTREFYSFAFAQPRGGDQVFWGLLVPLLLVAAIGFGVFKFRRAWPLLVIVAVAAAQAVVSNSGPGCGYCVQRSLLGLVPFIATLVAVGLAGVATLGRRAGAIVLVVVSVLGLGVSQTLVRTVDRAVDGAFVAPPYLPAMLDDVGRLPGRDPIHLEGFNSVPLWSWIELPTTYAAVDYRSRRRLSIAAEFNDQGGLTYWRTRPRGHPAYTPRYRWVLTRLGGVDTGRKDIARHGPLRLQQRSRPFDVSIVRGVATDIHVRDRNGTAWVQQKGAPPDIGPLTFWVSAETSSPAWLRLVLEGGPPELRLEADGKQLTQGRDSTGRLVACLSVPGAGPLRTVTASVQPPPPPPVYKSSGDFSSAPIPAKTIRLVSARAQLGCTVPAPAPTWTPTPGTPGP